MAGPVGTLKQVTEGLPVVALVGRPNVGKSTFFNRMIGSRRALTHNRPGVTRDRHYGEAEYVGREFVLIDTGGFEPDADGEDVFVQVRNQAMVAIDEADVVLVFLDARQGVLPGDFDLVELMRRVRKPVLYVVNKVDGPKQENDVYEFCQLGIDPFFPISSEHARGIDPLLDELVTHLPQVGSSGGGEGALESPPEALEDAWDEEAGPEGEDGSEPGDGGERIIRIAVVGRPNVGKSSLVNHMLGYDRQVIHAGAGTTRDSVDIPLEADGQRFVLIDTAGVRRKARISDRLEQYTVIKAFKAISRCDVVLLMLDATEGVTMQEQRLAGLVADKGRGVVLVINKWDLIEDDSAATRDAFREELLSQMEHVRYAESQFISALTGMGTSRLLERVRTVASEQMKEILTSEFNRFLEAMTTAHSPPIYKNRPVKVLYGTQVKKNPPTFLIVANHPDGIRPDYRRYLVNRMRESWGFVGSPVHLVVKGRRGPRRLR